MAIGLLSALTYAFVQDSRENFSTQNSMKVAETIFVQSNVVRSVIQQCVMEFPQGGGDLDLDGFVRAADNENTPYPLEPDDILNPAAPAGIAAAANNNARYLTCVGAPAGQAAIFQGAGNRGRFLPPPPSGFNEWTYHNDALGVYIQLTPKSNSIGTISAVERVFDRFANCQADLDYASCGTGCLTVWIERASCP